VIVTAPEDLLQQLSKDLRLLWTEAGGPSLRMLAAQVGLGKSQVSAIVNGKIRRPPDWDVVKNMIDSIRRYADDHGRRAELSLRTGVTEYWRPRYTVLEHAFRQSSRRSVQAQHPVPPDHVTVEPAAGTAAQIRPPVPRQLPAAPAFFTGRSDELARLTTIFDERASSSATALVFAVSGMGGVGKTWLVLQWAHRHVARFTDGQLFADLRGFSPSAVARNPADVLRGFLLALGVEAARIPLDLDDRVGLFRSLVADRRMLIILDNARDSDQLTPLLPGSSTCTVLVTSRNRLARLVAVHGAHAVPVDVFTDADACDLLAGRLGSDRLVAEPDALATLVARCAGLPLALSIIACRAQIHPLFPLAELAAGIDDTSTRLGVLDRGDPVVSLPAVLSWSYDALPTEQARLFGLLGLAPSTDLSLPAVANLIDTSLAHTAALLRELEDAHLVQEHQPGRYRMHDLIKFYAADRARRDLPPTGRLGGLRRLLDFLLHTAYTAEPLLVPYRIHAIPIDPARPVISHVLPDEASAWAWFETEHQSLLAAQRLALEQGWYGHAWQLGWFLRTFQYRRGLLHDLVATWQTGLAAAQHEDDPAPLSMAHRWLGDAYTLIGRHDDGMRHLNQALALAQDAGNPLIEALNHYGLAVSWARQGDDQRALEYATTALRMFHDLDQAIPEAELHNTVGWLYTRLGRYGQATIHLQTALTRFRRLHHLVGETNTLDSLGYLAHQSGHYQQALDYYHQALALYRQFNDSFYEADTLNRIGDTYAALGQHDQAQQARQQALRLYQTQHRTQDINAPNSA
jgi:tetratricopeptide (TPR) repeat protein